MLRILLIAPPGAGKGTQGAIISTHFDIPHIATGDLLRDHVERDDEIGREVAGYLQRGEMVPDDVVNRMVINAFTESKETGGGGYVLDGFPRTLEQAHAVYPVAKQMGMTASIALHLDVADDVVTRRLLARAAIQGRSDDNAEVIAKRLALYHEVTAPIIEYYRKRDILVVVDATPPVEVVAHRILTELEPLAAQSSETTRRAQTD